MASTSIQNAFHGKYDAFLSFRGEDTRKSFTDHLYAALKNKGIYVFKDDKELEKGGSISPNLLEAIEESRISIIVLSKNYASSTWCLDELVKIVECKKRDHEIFPIFYDVEPTAVRKQTTSFGEAFAKHEEAFKDNIEKLQKWRDALKVVANKSGWELKDSNESEFIDEIVNVISNKIRTKPEILKELVGIDSRLEKLRFLIGTESSDVRMMGIWGMGGIGKTTLARVVYDLISHEFDGSTFLANVREKSEKEGSVVSLQKQLLSDLLKLADISIWNVDDGINIIGSRLRQKKVLLVIDDVADVEQLQNLARKRDWFGPGSRIVITTRDKQLLVAHEVDEEHIYNLEVLSNDEALQLFSMKAFKTRQPMGEYVELSKRVLKYAGGLPLALTVLGSFLNGRSVDLWRSTLKRLKTEPPNRIINILQISFDGLQDLEKKIFLDVACFFKSWDRDHVEKILEGCGFSPVIGIEVLIEKSLLTVDDGNRLWMHDLLQELGHQIVQRQSPEQPGKRSRIWRDEEVRHMLTENTGSEVVEGIIVDAYFLENEGYLSAGAKAFSQMTNLRLLKIDNLQLPEGLEYLSNKLRLLDWHRYPLKSLPSNFQLEKTVEFNMCYSRIEELWNEIKYLNMLKVMKLSHSQNLIKTPDFTGVPNLEELILEGCTRLHEIHPSLLLHSKLVILNLKDCTSLTTLPGKISMKSLKTLVLSGCLKLTKKCLEFAGSMNDLSELFLDRTTIEELPLSIQHLTGLVLLNLKDCKNLKSLSHTLRRLQCLKNLTLSGCSKLKKFPESLGSMKDLMELFLDGTSIAEVPSCIELLTGLQLLNLNNCSNLVRLPSCINGLRSLKTLNLSGCSKLQNVPETLGQVESLEELDISGTAIRRPPSSIFVMNNLKTLSFSGCNGPPSSTSWHWHFPFNLMGQRSYPVALMLPSLSGLHSLSKLDLSDCGLGEGAIPNDIGNLCSLKQLNLSQNNFVTLPASINSLFNLGQLDLEDCKRLQSMPQLPSNLYEVQVNGCASLVTLSGALKLCKSKCTSINCIGSLKLAGNNGLAISMLREYLKAVSDPMKEFNIVVPGSEIPKWFMYQNEGSSITVTRPSYLYNMNKVVGYAICCVFHVPKHSTRSHLIQMLPCFFNGSGVHYFIRFKEKFGQGRSDHLWLLYLSREACRESNWHFESNHIELAFKPMSGPGLKVTRCGIHPVYMDEVEQFDQLTNQWTHFTSYNLNETSKRSLTEYVGAPEASGSGSCDDVEDPPPKRFRQLE
ncbi:ADP-ribosyl cyclase/cyclic ADP-ribose hydrolase [Citrus sinensis]|uniref:disease resistance protein RUN1-like isoform X1 n=1 Tax=Citrus sinensis TaxID=2711 RepID=UPI00219B9C11|nr:disease resistance protein RUN1-like isoform X1 [Citrus sinensis]XP_052294670.1 disease resistance protein RUN1-like isoform X1 [Citrus sinensis]XP_052294671.1 disease resistance protein RUN1-like isoform X1 [Citrus sinensis]KAH9725407.1 ADP-ribosyl cyclase/cyclic ADP-ribose hydrolase [Citrus sinensis]